MAKEDKKPSQIVPSDKKIPTRDSGKVGRDAGTGKFVPVDKRDKTPPTKSTGPRMKNETK